MDPSYWMDLYHPAYAGRPWILAVDSAAAATPLVETMHKLGAGPFLIIAASEGTGEPVDPEIAQTIVLGIGGGTFIETFRNLDAALVDLPADVVARIDAWDPDRSARVIQNFMPADVTIAGRRLYGSRPRAWMAVEDKIAVETLWDAAQVRRAPSAVVRSRASELAQAAAGLDRGRGTVWVADNREGWHGGAEYVRWVRDDDAAEQAAAFFAGCSDEVRVMPYLEGIPCSIHAIVFPEGIAAFNPVEILMLHRAGSQQFEYAGGATFWEPPEEHVASMRDMVRRVAGHLRDTIGYRGAFGIDGVLTAEGFYPTELNPRYTGGLAVQATTLHDDFSMNLLNMTIIEGEPGDYRPADFEEAVLASSARQRGGWALMKVPGAAPEETRSQRVVFVDGEARPAVEHGEAGATLSFGPAALGGLVFCSLDAGALPAGPPAAPAVISLFRLAAELWDEVDASDLEPATGRTPPGT